MLSFFLTYSVVGKDQDDQMQKLNASSHSCGKVPWITSVGSLEASRIDEYFGYLKAALSSAKRHAPSLIPFFIFAGNPKDIPSWFANFDNYVTIVNHNLSFYEMLRKKGVNPKYSVQHGSYIRLDISNILPKMLPHLRNASNVDTNYVLYTDTDVMFYADINSCLLKKPAIIAMGPEIERNSSTNSGVMFMNVSAMGKELPSLLKFAAARRWAFRTYDQQLILDYKWSKDIEQIGDEFNWKGYWGDIPENNAPIRIFHFHGLKPGQCLECFLTYRSIIQSNSICSSDCKHYKFLWKIVPDKGEYYEKVLHQFYSYTQNIDPTVQMKYVTDKVAMRQSHKLRRPPS